MSGKAQVLNLCFTFTSEAAVCPGMSKVSPTHLLELARPQVGLPALPQRSAEPAWPFVLPFQPRVPWEAAQPLANEPGGAVTGSLWPPCSLPGNCPVCRRRAGMLGVL